MVQLKRWLITVFSLLAIIAILGFVKFTQIKAAIAFGESFPEPSETVKTTVIEASNWQPELKVVAQITAKRSVQLRNEVEGIITKVGFSSGAAVNQGDVLLQLDIATETAQLEAINAEIELAKLDVKRASDLLEVRASSRDQLDRANSQLAVNRARARSQQAIIDRKTVIAPFSGTTSIHDWEVGTYIEANTVITELVGDLSTVWVDFAIPQWHANIKIGEDVKVLVSDGMTYIAKVSAINQQVSSASRAVQVRAALDNSQVALKPGMVVNVLLPIEQAITVYPVPNEALRFDSFGSYVFTLQKDENGDYRATRQPVKFAAREGRYALLTSGVETDDIVATVGSSKLQAGKLAYLAQEVAPDVAQEEAPEAAPEIAQEKAQAKVQGN